MSDVAVAGVCGAPMADRQNAFSLEDLEDSLKSHAQQVLSSSASPSSKYDALEIELRKHLLSSKDLSKDWDNCWNLCLYILTHSDLNVRKLPFVLLEDLVETLSMDALQHFWSTSIIHMEQRLCSGVMWDTDSGNSHVLQWIRLQNALLRRLPNTRSKGDVLMTMAKVLPLSDRSAMKQWGSVAGSPVDYEDDDEYKQDTFMMENNDTALPFSFYDIFWSLQHDMANPYSISFGKFFQSSKTVLAAMESKPLFADAMSGSGGSIPHAFTQKYLTRGRLLPLQLQDPSFRACWLTQFCIVVSFVGSQSTSLKTTLTELANRAKQLLTMLPNGELFVKHLEWILNERETMWRAWKKNKCKPDMEPPPIQGGVVENHDQNEIGAVETKSTRVLLEATTVPPRHLQLEDLVLEKSTAVPNVYNHLEEYVDALDPEAGIDAEYHPKHNANFCWQALRLLARDHLDCFEYIRHSDGDFERMVRHIYAKRGIRVPGQAPPEEEEHDHDAERDQSVERTEEQPDNVPANDEETPPVHVAMEDAEETESTPEEADEKQQVVETVEDHAQEPEEEDGVPPKSNEEHNIPKEEEDVSKEEESMSPREPGAREDKALEDEIMTEENADQVNVREVALDDSAKMEKEQDKAKDVATEEEALTSAEGEVLKETKDGQSDPLTAFEKMAMEEEALLLAEGEEMTKKLQESADTESKQEPTKPEKPKPNDAKPKQDPVRGAPQNESKSDDRKRRLPSPVMNESSAKRPRENPRSDNRGRRDDDSRRAGWAPGAGRGPPPPHRGPPHRGGGRADGSGRGDGPGMRRGGPPPPRGGRGDDGRRAPRGRDTRRRY